MAGVGFGGAGPDHQHVDRLQGHRWLQKSEGRLVSYGEGQAFVDQPDHSRTAQQSRNQTEARSEFDVSRDSEPIELRLRGCDPASAGGGQVRQGAELLQRQRRADGLIVDVDRTKVAVREQKCAPKVLVFWERVARRNDEIYLIAFEALGVINGRG